jgi:hypothetical protein
VQVPREYAKLLDLDPDDIYDHGLVAERIVNLEPRGDATKERLINMCGVQLAQHQKKKGDLGLREY